MIGILDLNDVALRLWHRDDCVHSPGYVWFDGSGYHFGHRARQTSRRSPKAVNTRFWSQLGTQTLAPALGPARHTADLAHSHLTHIHEAAGGPQRVLVAAPGNMTREQLSLLLGIVQHLPFDIAGLVHRTGVLGAASGLPRGMHIELQLHQTVVTGFDTEQGTVHARPSQALPGQGWLALQDKLATTIAGLFVNQTRFDPLRTAEGEQGLYDALPALLIELSTQSETRLAIADYEARITREDVSPVGQRLAKQIEPLLEEQWPVLLEEPLTLLPGFDLHRDAHSIASEAVASFITEHLPSLEQAPDALTLRRQVPTAAQPCAVPLGDGTLAPQAAVELAASPGRATHILSGFTARPLAHNTELNGGATLRFDGDALTLAGTVAADFLVNGSTAQPGQRLAPGDTLTDSLGLDAVLIVVED